MVYLHVDISDLLGLKELEDKVNEAAKMALADLAAQTHSHIAENVQAKLHSTREKYLDALSIQQVDDATWLINLDAKAEWIESGLSPHSMVDDLLKSPKAKTAADGSKFLVVPFEHKKGPASSTPAQKSLTDTIKEEFKRRKIPYGKLEVDAAGNPKKGVLHSFDINHSPIKTANGVGQGHGPIGAVKQGHTGIPFLKGIRVSQKEIKDPASGKSKVVKQITTFRVVTSKDRGTNRWWHPGVPQRNFLDEAMDWAERQWDEKIKEKLFISIEKSI